MNYIFSCTNFLDVQQPTLNARIACIFNSIVEIPRCKTCNKELDIHGQRVSKRIKQYCSNSCMASALDVQKAREMTMVKRYGVKYALQDKNVSISAQEKSKRTCKARYGVEHAMQCDVIKRKVADATISHYGVTRIFCTPKSGALTPEQYASLNEAKQKIEKTCLEKYGETHHMKNSSIYQKSRNTCKKIYGTEYPIQLNQIKDKLKTTNLEKYGVEWNIASDSSKQKAKCTNIERYGVEYPMQNPYIYEKYQTALRTKHNVSHNSQMLETRRKASYKYVIAISLTTNKILNVHDAAQILDEYTYVRFDSLPELALYVYLHDMNIDFSFHPDISFTYDFNGQLHSYFPDFMVGDTLIEIKGNQFVKSTGEWQCPWDHTLDSLYEAKHKCAMANNVTIMYTQQYMQYVKYLMNAYGRQYVLTFKRVSYQYE